MPIITSHSSIILQGINPDTGLPIDTPVLGPGEGMLVNPFTWNNPDTYEEVDLVADRFELIETTAVKPEDVISDLLGNSLCPDYGATDFVGMRTVEIDLEDIQSSYIDGERTVEKRLAVSDDCEIPARAIRVTVYAHTDLTCVNAQLVLDPSPNLTIIGNGTYDDSTYPILITPDDDAIGYHWALVFHSDGVTFTCYKIERSDETSSTWDIITDDGEGNTLADFSPPGGEFTVYAAAWGGTFERWDEVRFTTHYIHTHFCTTEMTGASRLPKVEQDATSAFEDQTVMEFDPARQTYGTLSTAGIEKTNIGINDDYCIEFFAKLPYNPFPFPMSDVETIFITQSGDIKIYKDYYNNSTYVFGYGYDDENEGGFKLTFKGGTKTIEVIISGPDQEFAHDITGWGHFALMRKDGTLRVCINGWKAKEEEDSEGALSLGTLLYFGHNNTSETVQDQGLMTHFRYCYNGIPEGYWTDTQFTPIPTRPPHREITYPPWS